MVPMRFLRLCIVISPFWHCFGTVLTLFGTPIQANRTRDIGQNSVKYRPTVPYTVPPFQQRTELHQFYLRINLELVHILGMVLRHVLQGGHVLGLKSNRRLFGVPAVINPSTCRYSSHNAVSKSH